MRRLDYRYIDDTTGGVGISRVDKIVVEPHFG